MKNVSNDIQRIRDLVSEHAEALESLALSISDGSAPASQGSPLANGP